MNSFSFNFDFSFVNSDLNFFFFFFSFAFTFLSHFFYNDINVKSFYLNHLNFFIFLQLLLFNVLFIFNKVLTVFNAAVKIALLKAFFHFLFIFFNFLLTLSAVMIVFNSSSIFNAEAVNFIIFKFNFHFCFLLNTQNIYSFKVSVIDLLMSF